MSKILIVDDEKNVLDALESLLVECGGLTVLSAADWESALDVLSSSSVDLIVADEMMPVLKGSKLLQTVARDYPGVQRILMTEDVGALTDETRAALGESVPIVEKPWNADELRKTVLDLLRQDIEQAAESIEEMLRTDSGVSETALRRAERVRSRLAEDRSLGDVLVELGEITSDDYQELLARRRSRITIAQILLEDGELSEAEYRQFLAELRAGGPESQRELLVGHLVTEEAYLRAYAAKSGHLYLEPETGLVDRKVLGRTSFRYLLRVKALPVHVLDGRLRVIMADPEDAQLRGELERMFRKPLEICCAPKAKIEEALRTLQRLKGSGGEPIGDSGGSLQYREIDEIEEGEGGEEEAVQIVDYLLMRAIQMGASDLHIEPLQARIRVRVRIDGVLQKLTDLPVEYAPRVVSRLKILAGADISERRMHQDGKIFVKTDGAEVDIRLSSYVSVHGETIVMRLLNRNKGILPLDSVGFTPTAYDSLTEVVLESSSGLVMLVGPTGSGKTTTLYSFIDHANDPSEKVITAEDPVEYVIDGLVQCSVNNKTGPTFSDSLRAIVRQDPDTIVVGEVRDANTVNLALESALTGHKVFSTFHTEDAVGAFVRLLEMGAEPFLVASTVSAIIAQRLVRRLCTKCRKPGDATAAEARFLGLERSELRGKFNVAVGCDACSATGYKGRLAIHEVLLPDDDLRDAIMHRAPAKELREQARKLSEFLTLQEDGVLKAYEGKTSLAEIISNAPRDTNGRPLETLVRLSGIGRSR